eukprot:TRINITY_DN7541_c0_g1_i1.p1 TRINITY_DN7541_c0_g1~~TRINITY_DN7541_c0_g1_i1.p1  ORF type:complete len:304 (+),score=69.73 TRINITY_DN7541_c0_g1_i1:84-914(+)
MATEASTMLSIGFIGGGMMAEALLGGLIAQGVTDAAHVIISEPFEPRRKYMEEKFKVKTTTANQEVVNSSQSGVVVLAVKPQMLAAAMAGVQVQPASSPLFVSIIAGCPLARLQELVGARVARVMPNTPSLVGLGASGFVLGSGAQKEDAGTVERVMGAVGLACPVSDEKLLDAVTGVSGSGPAYAYMLIDAMSDGGVKNGLPRDVARTLAAQTVMGAAKMVLETQKHPGQLKNEVESPGGTTIAGTSALEAGNFRHAVISAVSAAAARSTELGKL